MKNIIVLAMIVLMAGAVQAHDPNSVVSVESPFHFEANTVDPNHPIITMSVMVTPDELKSRKRPGSLAYFKQQVLRIMDRNMRMYDAWLASKMTITEKENATKE